jgi:hypothetical protein
VALARVRSRGRPAGARFRLFVFSRETVRDEAASVMRIFLQAGLLARRARD